MRVLKLDASFHPVEVIPWEKAFYLICKDKARVIEWYDERYVRSPNKKHKVPSVITVDMVLDRHKHAKFCRDNVFIRDNYTCQYCGAFGEEIELTYDHITPRMMGGATDWMNIVTACGPCNRKKGCKTLIESGMKLMQTPFIPKWTPKASIKLKKGDPPEWENYVKY
jgi:5-methylcytosine-specific restriction endonuclease McrA